MTPPPVPPLPAQLLVMAKSPVPGLAKTRLSPPYTPTEAAELADAALRDTLDAVMDTPVQRRVVALEGEAGDWLPTGVDVILQRGDGLDERIGYALEDAWSTLPLPVLLVGMDTPQVTAPELEQAARWLLTPGTDAVLGPAEDGGFWALGLQLPSPEMVRGVAMSTSRTGAVQLERLRAAGLRVRLLPTVRDVDTALDVSVVASAAPRSRFAAVVSRLGAAGRPDVGTAAEGAA